MVGRIKIPSTQCREYQNFKRYRQRHPEKVKEWNDNRKEERAEWAKTHPQVYT